MSEFFKAELKDKFLQYAMDRDDYFETRLLYDEFLRPNYSLEYVEKLVKEVIDQDPNLLDIMSGNGVKIFMLSSTPYTEDFLEEGGFKDLFVQEEEKWDMFLDQLANTRKLSPREKANLGQTEKVTYTRERILLFSLITAVAISFLFTVFSLFKPLFVLDNTDRIDQIEARLDILDRENSVLREQLQYLDFQSKAKDSVVK